MSKEKENFKLIDNLIKDTGFPLLSTTDLAINKICQKAKKDGHKVIIGGNGADEIFSGYYAHHLSYLLSIKKNKNYKTEFRNWKNKTVPFIRTEILKNLEMYKKNLKKQGFKFETYIYQKFLKIDYKTKNLPNNIDNKIKDLFIKHLDNDLFSDTLPTQAHNMDNISMHNSIESRMPYLNHYFYNFRNSISKNFLIKNGIAKYILREAFLNKLPKKIILNPEKTGFYLPLNETIDIKSKKFINLISTNKYLNKIIKINVIKDKIKVGKLTQQEQKFCFLLYNAASFLKLYTK